MTRAELLFMAYEVCCFSYCAFLFYMVGRNQHTTYQTHRRQLTTRLRLPDINGLFYFFAVVLLINVGRVMQPLFD
jgi:hypothetical protein